ncbi:MAG TPA: LuxR C-terminal-related transcriptional regulator [Solirubrobacteraceae bacterium]|nr:LuxR C-terminal-related transcriptional regulator [Solirubrobacteraceae bacterium]
MDAGLAGEHLRKGWQALEGARWDAARAAFETALAAGETPDALDGLGLAVWFLGDVKEGIAARERAFEGYVRCGNCDDAARLAVWVSHQHLIGGRASAARGWLSRAERAVEDAGPCVGQGWVAVERARHAESVEECAAHARRAMAIAREAGDGDLEVFALSLLGRTEVSAGRKRHGMQLLEEAMAAATAGRVRNVHTLAEAYCNLIMACTSAGEWERAAEWCELVDEFAREHGATPLLGACRTVHADVLLAAGRWADAESALESALEAHARYVPAMGAPTVATMAELRVRQGRLREAEQLLVGREEHPESLRALAHLRIAQSQPHVAAALLERGLLAAEGNAVRTTQLLAPLVDARLACGQIGAAETAAARLATLAGESGIAVVGARADLAAARVALARERAGDAAEPARRALAEFSRLAMPLELGEARLALARALARQAPDVAREEARVAFATFRELGAARAMDLAAAVLRELGSATGGRPRSTGELTAREREVLELLALGMSNAQIAQTLVITEKTAGHHVSRILSKLGVRNRAEAAAHAARRGGAATAR